MKSCPTCRREYEDTLTYCLIDGAILSSPNDPNVTLQFPEPRKTEPPTTEVLPSLTNQVPLISSPSTQETLQSPLSPTSIPEARNESVQKQGGKRGKIVTGVAFSFVVILLIILLAIAVGWGIYNSIQITKEREARIRAEQEAESNRVALTAAERRAKEAEELVAAEEAIREGKEVWRVVKIENRTEGEIPYQLLCDGTTYTYTVEKGGSLIHSFNSDILLIFDYQYTSGYQEKRYRVTSKYVVGHKPTEAEEQQALVNYFELDKDGNIVLYLEK